MRGMTSLASTMSSLSETGSCELTPPPPPSLPVPTHLGWGENHRGQTGSGCFAAFFDFQDKVSLCHTG